MNIMSIFSKIKERVTNARTKTKAIVAGVTLALAGIVAIAMLGSASAITVTSGVYDCTDNSVVVGGASSVSALQSKYANGATCTESNGTKLTEANYHIQDVYHGFGISASDVSAMSTDEVAGYVTKTGDVYVGTGSNATLVATDAYTAGRIGTASELHTYGATDYYVRTPSVSFEDPALSAMVMMKDGVFQHAILNACGNPVNATPKKPNYSIVKKVRVGNSGSYSSNTPRVPSGTTVEYQITVSSTGQVPVTGVVVRDPLPKYLTYVPNTLAGDGTLITDQTLINAFFHGSGGSIPSIPAGGTYTITFSAVAGNTTTDTNVSCAAEDIDNTGYMTAPGLSNQQSSVSVDTTCVPPAAATLSCVSLVAVAGTADSEGNTLYTLNATASKNATATITKYVFTPDTKSTATVPIVTANTTASTTHTYAPGTYTASVTVYGNDNVTNKAIPTVASQTCTVPITIKTPTPKTPNYTIQKLVRAGNSGNYTSNVTVPSGSTVEYQITVSSTGQVPVTNVLVRDARPTNINYTSGTLEENGTAMSASDVSEFFETTGYNIPSIANGSQVVFTFSATAGNTATDTDSSCMAENLDNTGYISTTGLSNQQSSANVDTTCTPPPTPGSLACVGLSDTPGDIDATTGAQQFTFTGQGSADKATITQYKFTVTNSTTKQPVTSMLVPTTTSAQEVTTASQSFAPGDYTATVVVSGTDNSGNAITAPANTKCTIPFTVPTPGTPNYTIQKLVRAGNSGNYTSNVTVPSGTTVEYQITVSSTGQVPVTNVLVHDLLPTYINYTSGTLEENGTAMAATDATNFFGTGYTISSIANGSQVVFTFSATAGNTATDTDSSCVAENLDNTAYISATGMGNQEGSATVDTTCTTTPTPPTVPPVLPNTGAGDTIGIFIGTVVAGTIGARLFLSRKLARR